MTLLQCFDEIGGLHFTKNITDPHNARLYFFFMGDYREVTHYIISFSTVFRFLTFFYDVNGLCCLL